MGCFPKWRCPCLAKGMHGVKEKRYMVKGMGWRKFDVSIVCSVAGLSRGMFSQLVRPCLVKGMV